jgi:hypothetical protein
MNPSGHHKVTFAKDKVTCTCRRNDGLACAHIIHVAEKTQRMSEFINPLPWKAYTHPCYTIETFQAMYDGCYIFPCTEAILVESVMLPPSVDENFIGSARIRSGWVSPDYGPSGVVQAA